LYSKEDPVYLDNEQFRREYVLCESGKIYRGTYKNPKAFKWSYGQFSDIILPMACLFLDRFTEANRDTIDYSQRGSPVYVARALAYLVSESASNSRNE
jgi:transglutaminase 1